jgi:porin
LAIAMALASGVQAKEPAKETKPQSVWDQEKLTGDWGGARIALKDRGLEFSLTYIGETFHVFSGGLRNRTAYEGRADLSVDTDLEKLIGWTGASTHVTVFGIHNSGHNTLDYVGSISDPSNIDAYRTVRLFTAWFQQGDPDKDLVSVRFGQLAADDEFFTSETAAGLINGTFGWGDLFAANLASGGPAYPLATPGVRVRVNPTEQLAVLGAVFSGDPAGHDCFDIPQRCNAHGTTFSFTGGSLWIGELQYRVNQGKQAAGLPGAYKVGAWYATASYADQHFGLGPGNVPLTLADPSLPDPLFHRGNWGVYGVVDQMVWRGPASSLTLFVRGGGSPSDRNLVSYYVDGGAGLKGPLLGRPDDTLTFGVAYVKISRDAVALDQDMLTISGAPFAVRDKEVVFELSYAAQIAPWWILQPDIQYIVHPNGGQNPDDPTLPLDHGFFAGLRSTIKF